jgi:lipoprotein-releasing system permease protein
VVKTANPYAGLDETAFDIYGRLGGGFSVYSWRQLQAAQYSSYESTRQMLIFIMAIVTLVAAVNVSAAVSMLVIERQRDIAVLKSTGGSGGDVSLVFLLCAVLSGFAGAIPGIACGLAIGCNVNVLIRALETVLSFASSLVRGGEVKILDPGFYLQEIPVVVDWKTVAAIGLLTILCSAAASLIPSLRAGKSRPLDLLRKF